MRRSLVFLLVFLVGCGGGAAAESAAPSVPMAPASPISGGDAAKDSSPAPQQAPGGAPQPITTPVSNQAAPEPMPKARPSADDHAATRDLVIYTASYAMAVYQVDQGIAAVERIAKEQNGYLAVKKDREITIRVPRGHFEAALAGVDKIGDVLHRDIEALDVTDEHVDLEIRIKNARAVQKQLIDLLAKAQVKEALEIEKELARVTEDLERLEGKLKLMNDKIAFSTITVTFEPRGSTLQTQRVKLPFGWLSSLGLPNLLQLSEDK